jgi:hypothetical protein
MNTIFSGNILSCYSQAYVHLQDTFDIAEDVMGGQINGLLGAAIPTLLFLILGVHTGQVKLTINVTADEPELDDKWEEVVEASFLMPEQATLGLTDWGGSIWVPIPLNPGSYRVRYTTVNFGETDKRTDQYSSLSDFLEEYELTFWLAPSQSDRILKATRSAAKYWHGVGKAT